jgi:hypothetical protein
MHGVPRAFLAVQARRGDPLARLLANHGRGDDPYPLMEQIRADGPLVRTPFAWASVRPECVDKDLAGLLRDAEQLGDDTLA